MYKIFVHIINTYVELLSVHLDSSSAPKNLNAFHESLIIQLSRKREAIVIILFSS